MRHTDYQHYRPVHVALNERCFPHRVMEGVWLWSIFSEEKALYFNGYLIETTPGKSFIVDPPCGGPEVLDAFEALPKPEMILITNRDHERSADMFKQRFNIPVLAPEMDAPLLINTPDRIYRDGETFTTGWQAIQLTDQKSPGECVLYNPERRMAILGDALIGQSTQHLSMLPADKYRSKRDALQGLQRLRKLDVNVVLPCDGDPIVQDGSALISEALLEGARELELQHH